MPINEKEYNGNLMDQLHLLEDIIDILEYEGQSAETLPQTFKTIAKKKRQINEKLYQDPPLVNS